ncbi:uncharacterized protein METZ01_LOCUS237393, partial [marine metagenome]
MPILLGDATQGRSRRGGDFRAEPDGPILDQNPLTFISEKPIAVLILNAGGNIDSGYKHVPPPVLFFWWRVISPHRLLESGVRYRNNSISRNSRSPFSACIPI